jgi:hypothetical protein
MLAVQNGHVAQARLPEQRTGTVHSQHPLSPKPRIVILVSHRSYRAGAFLAASKRLNIDAVVVTDATQASELLSPGSVMSAPLEDPARSVHMLVPRLSNEGITAVIGTDDSTLPAASLLARSLGCPHVSPESVVRTRDKYLTRSTLSTAGLAQPRFALAQPGSSASLAKAANSVGLPCVLKPRSLSGSQGVIRANDLDQVTQAGTRIRAILERLGLENQEIILESYVPGKEYAVDAIVLPGSNELEILAIFDKPEPLAGPFFEETIYTTPSRAPQRVQDAMIDTLAKAVEALGIDRGPIHAELRVPQGKESGTNETPLAYLIEIATRTIGGRCSEMLSFSSVQPHESLNESLNWATGEPKTDAYSLEELVLASALGIHLAHRETLPAGVLMLQVPAKGRFSGIRGRQAILSLPRIVGLEMSIHPGEMVEPLPEGDRYAGFVFAKAQPGFDAHEVDQVAKRAKALEELRIIEQSLLRAKKIAGIEVTPSS